MWHKYKILAQKEKIEQIMRGEFPVPSMANLHLSYICNQHCKSCAYADYNKNKYIPKKEDAFRYVGELINFGIRAFDISGGGEPTTLPYFHELIRYIVDEGCNYGLATNGSLMTEGVMNLLGDTATYIRFSLETGDIKLYSEYKGVPKEVFNRVLGNLIYLTKHRHPDTEIGIKYDVDNILYGEEHIRHSLEILKDIGADVATFKSMAGPSSLDATQKEWLSGYLDRMARETDTGRTKVINAIINKYPVPKCVLTPLHTSVDGRGFVYLCCYYYGIPDHSIGNLNEKSFKSIWGSNIHREKENNINPKDCAQFDCKFFAHHEILSEAFKRGRLDIV
jgi:radical SAM protein with 4Fe4S-binding SPASM domain